MNQAAKVLEGSQDAGALNLAGPVAAPASAPTAVATTGTALGVGTYQYAVTYVTGHLRDDTTMLVVGETTPSATVSVTTTTGNQAVTLTSLPTSAATTVIGKRLYRTAVGGAQRKLVATLPAGVTSYVDTTPDASLGANEPTTNTTGTNLAIGGKSVITTSGGTYTGDITAPNVHWGMNRTINLASGTDVNTLTESGWYDGTNLVNAPNGATSWYRIEHIAHSLNSTWSTQTAWDFNTIASHYERRSYDNAGVRAWTAWQLVWNDANVGPNAPNGSVQLVNALLQQTDTRTTVLTYTSGNLTTVQEKDGAVVVKTTTLAYSSGRLSTVTETVAGKTITTTLNYNADGTLANTTRTVN